MKNQKLKIKVSSCTPILGVVVFSALATSALSKDIQLQWNGNASSLAQSFKNALNQAKTGDRIKLGKRMYKTDRSILINKSVHIVGVNRNDTVIQATKNMQRLFQVDADNVTFYSLCIDGNNKAMNGINNFRSAGLRVQNSRVKRAVNYNIGNANNYPNRGLNVIGSQIQGGVFGVGILNRNNKVTGAGNVEKVTIDRATITGFAFTAVEIDCANDLGNYLTNFNYTRVANSSMNGPGKFCVGSTLSKRLIFERNTLTCAHDPTHFEFKSREIQVKGNTLRTTANGNFACVALIPGDRIIGPSNGSTPVGDGYLNSTPANHANGCRAITITNNKFVGSANWGLLSVEAADCTVKFNDFRSLNIRNGKNTQILLTDAAGARSGFGGSSKSQGSKRFTIAGNPGLNLNRVQYQQGVGHKLSN